MFTHKKLAPKKDQEDVINALKQMQEKSTETAELLYCCSYLHNKDIPDLLLEYFFKDKTDISNIIRIADENSLIAINQENKTFSIPEQIQEIIRDYLASEKKGDNYLLKMANTLYQAYPLKTTKKIDRADQEFKKLFQPHLDKILSYLDCYSSQMNPSADKNLLNACILKHLIIYSDSCWYLGDIVKQKELLEKAYKIISNDETTTTIDEYIQVLTGLGICYGAENNFEKAKIFLEDALLKEESKAEKNNVNVAFISAYLGQIYVKLNMAHRGKEILENALKDYENISSEDRLTLAVILNNLGNAYSALNEHHKAIESLQKSLAVKKEIYGDEHPVLSVTFLRLGIENKELANMREAEEQLTKALKINDKAAGVNNPLTFEILVHLCELSLMQKDKGKITDFLTRAKQFCTDAQKESRLKKLEDNFEMAFKQEFDSAKPFLKETSVTKFGTFQVTKVGKNEFEDKDKHISQNRP